KSLMKALMSAWTRRGSWSEYFKSMSGAAISSTMERSQVLPQNLSNQRPTTALLVFSLDIVFPFVQMDTNLFLSAATSCSAYSRPILRTPIETPFLDFKFLFGERASFAPVSDVLLRRGDFNRE